MWTECSGGCEMVKQWFLSQETETGIKLEDISGVSMPFLFLDESHRAEGVVELDNSYPWWEVKQNISWDDTKGQKQGRTIIRGLRRERSQKRKSKKLVCQTPLHKGKFSGGLGKFQK